MRQTDLVSNLWSFFVPVLTIALKARELLIYCKPHVLDSALDLSFDEYYFANGVYADMWLGRLGTRLVAAKVWRGASLSPESRKRFVIVSRSFAQHQHSFTPCRQRLSEELDHWKQLKHPNIVSFIGVTACRGPLPALILPHHVNGNATVYAFKNPLADVLHLVSVLVRKSG